MDPYTVENELNDSALLCDSDKTLVFMWLSWDSKSFIHRILNISPIDRSTSLKTLPLIKFILKNYVFKCTISDKMKTLALFFVIFVVAINTAIVPQEEDKDVEEVSNNKCILLESCDLKFIWRGNILYVLQKTWQVHTRF